MASMGRRTARRASDPGNLQHHYAERTQSRLHTGEGFVSFYDEGQGTEFAYDIDRGSHNRISMAEASKKSPLKYSSMSSRTARFGPVDGAHRDTPDVVQYEIDHLHKSGFSTTIRDSPRRYGAEFKSRAPRLGHQRGPDGADAFYDGAIRHGSIMDEVAKSPKTFVQRTARFVPDMGVGNPCGPKEDPIYAVDRHNTVADRIAKSPMSYSTLRSKDRRFKSKPQTSTPEDVGPGAYALPPKTGVTAFPKDSDATTPRRRSTPFASTVPRFRETTEFKDEEYRSGASTFTFQRDQKEWQRKGMGGVMSRAVRRT